MACTKLKPDSYLGRGECLGEHEEVHHVGHVVVLDGELVAGGRLAVAVVQDLQLEDAQPNPGTDLELGVGHPDHARLHFDFVPPTSL